MRIDDHDFGFVQVTLASEGIKSDHGPRGIMFDSMEMSFQKFAKGDLTALRDIDQLTELVNEQIDSVGLKPLLR